MFLDAGKFHFFSFWQTVLLDPLGNTQEASPSPVLKLVYHFVAINFLDSGSHWTQPSSLRTISSYADPCYTCACRDNATALWYGTLKSCHREQHQQTMLQCPSERDLGRGWLIPTHRLIKEGFSKFFYALCEEWVWDSRLGPRYVLLNQSELLCWKPLRQLSLRDCWHSGN